VLKSSDIAIGVMGEICEWLRANDVEPSIVPLWAVPKLAGGRLATPVHLLRDGKKYVVDGEVAMGSIDVPLKVEPPASLAEWLASEEG